MIHFALEDISIRGCVIHIDWRDYSVFKDLFEHAFCIVSDIFVIVINYRFNISIIVLFEIKVLVYYSNICMRTELESLRGF